jgi:hypothetical protein
MSRRAFVAACWTMAALWLGGSVGAAFTNEPREAMLALLMASGIAFTALSVRR